jgi:hypothetical protein
MALIYGIRQRGLLSAPCRPKILAPLPHHRDASIVCSQPPTMDTLYDTGFMVLAAGTAAAGALISLVSYYVWGSPAQAPPAPEPGRQDGEPAAEQPIEKPVEQPPSSHTQEAALDSADPKSSGPSARSPLKVLQPSTGGSTIRAVPVKQRIRAPPRTLPSRGHHKARPAIDPRSEFHRDLIEQSKRMESTWLAS